MVCLCYLWISRPWTVVAANNQTFCVPKSVSLVIAVFGNVWSKCCDIALSCHPAQSTCTVHRLFRFRLDVAGEFASSTQVFFLCAINFTHREYGFMPFQNGYKTVVTVHVWKREFCSRRGLINSTTYQLIFKKMSTFLCWWSFLAKTSEERHYDENDYGKQNHTRLYSSLYLSQFMQFGASFKNS